MYAPSVVNFVSIIIETICVKFVLNNAVSILIALASFRGLERLLFKIEPLSSLTNFERIVLDAH